MKLVLLSMVMSLLSLGAFAQATQDHLIVPICKKKETDTCRSLSKDFYKTLKQKIGDSDISASIMIGKADLSPSFYSLPGSPVCLISIAFSSEETELKVKKDVTRDVLRNGKRAQNLINQMEDHSTDEGYIFSLVRYSSGASKSCDDEEIGVIHGHEVTSLFIER